ncbi:MAG: amidohydrolase family protein, partial [Burkholderiales bacterium]
ATMLAVLLHEGHHRRGVPVERIAALVCANPARQYGLASKGQIAIGRDADLVLVDPDLARTVDPARLESFADYSPWEGMELQGWPVRTFVRGREVMRDGAIVAPEGEAPGGRFVRRL